MSRKRSRPSRMKTVSAAAVTIKPMPPVDQSNGLRLRRLNGVGGGGGSDVGGAGGVVSIVTRSPPQRCRGARERRDFREITSLHRFPRRDPGAADRDHIRLRQIVRRDLLVDAAGGKEFQ